MGPYGSGARWHYTIAIEHGDVALARWCLAHGANPTSVPARDSRLSKRTLYEDALVWGQTEIAQLLAQHGAARSELNADDAFMAAARRGDLASARKLAAQMPELAKANHVVHAAARENRAAMLQLLLELGASPDVAGPNNERPLHQAAYAGAEDTTRVLLDAGAEVDSRETRFGGTPLGWAVHADRAGTIALLAERSRDIWNHVYAGNVARVRAVLDAEPALVNATHGADGETPLMWYPSDDARALEIARICVTHGVDLSARNGAGEGLVAIAERRALYDTARFLREHGAA
jgi:ankyrin repeat protein